MHWSLLEQFSYYCHEGLGTYPAHYVKKLLSALFLWGCEGLHTEGCVSCTCCRTTGRGLPTLQGSPFRESEPWQGGLVNPNLGERRATLMASFRNAVDVLRGLVSDPHDDLLTVLDSSMPFRKGSANYGEV